MSLLQKAVRGAAWTTVTSMAARLFSLFATLIVTHRIAPFEYGQASAAAVVALSVNMLSSLWIANYLIVDKDALQNGAWLATWSHQLIGIIVIGASLPLAPYIGHFVDAPDLPRYLPGAALAVLIDRLSTVPEKIVVRDLRFRELALTRMTGEMTYGAVTFATAWAGAGGMALIYGMLARSVARSGTFAIFVPWQKWLQPRPFDAPLARRMFDYGLPLWIGNLTGFIGTNWDNLLVSRYFGPAVMATYSLAFNFTDMPAAQVGEQLSEVLLPSFAQLDEERRPAALVRSLLVVCLVTFPVAVGLGAIAPTLVRAIFDARWEGLAPFIIILSARAITRTAFYPIIQYLQAVRRTRTQMLLTATQTFFVLSIIASIGSRSPILTCYAVDGCSLGLFLVSLVLIGRQGVPIAPIAFGLIKILVACAVMAAAVLGMRHFAIAHMKAPLLLLCEIVTGGIVFVGAALLIAPAPARDLISWMKRGLGRRADA